MRSSSLSPSSPSSISTKEEVEQWISYAELRVKNPDIVSLDKVFKFDSKRATCLFTLEDNSKMCETLEEYNSAIVIVYRVSNNNGNGGWREYVLTESSINSAISWANTISSPNTTIRGEPDNIRDGNNNNNHVDNNSKNNHDDDNNNNSSNSSRTELPLCMMPGPKIDAMERMLECSLQRRNLFMLKTEAEDGSIQTQNKNGFNVYLFRESLSQVKFQAKIAKLDEQDRYHLVPLSDVWRLLHDSESLAALCLFHEFRYHGLVPAYRPPPPPSPSCLHHASDVSNSSHSTELAEPKWSKIAEVNEKSSGLNLAVKIVEIIDNHRIKVGDETGIIEVVGKEHENMKCVGVSVLLRNVSAGSASGRLVLHTSSWGKIDLAEKEVEDVFYGTDFSAFQKVSAQIFDIRGPSRRAASHSLRKSSTRIESRQL